MIKTVYGRNAELHTKTSKIFERDYFKLLNNAACCKTMENVRKHFEIKIATADT